MNSDSFVPAKQVYSLRDLRCGEGTDRELLSVSLYRGVVPRSKITDKEPRADDLASYKSVEPGEIVINRMSAYQGALGIARQRGIVSPEYLVLRVSEAVEARFLTYLFKSSWFVGEMASRVRGIGSLEQGNVRTPRINPEDLGRIRVPLPSLADQKAVADFLDAETARIDALISKKQRLALKLRERRLAITLRGVAGQSLSNGRLVASRLPWLASRPEHWQESLLRLVARLGSGHTPSRSRPEWWIDCTIPWITTGEVAQMREDRIEYITETREKISEVGMANSSAELHPAGTVVLSRTASAGFSAMMGRDMATSQDFVTWTCGPLLEPRYLLLCLRAMRPDLLGRLAQGSTHKTIYMPDIESIRIPLPPLEEQRAIVDTVWRSLNRIDETINLLNQQITLLAEHRQALITAAVTGEIEVPGATVA